MSAVNKNFWLNRATFIDFIVVILSCTVLSIEKSEDVVWGLRRSVWLWIHVGAGFTLLSCLILHIAQHWWWFKAAFRCTGRAKSNKVLRNRTIIGLLIVSALTILSGALTYIKSVNPVAGNPLVNTSELWVSYHRWKGLHQTGAILMFVLVVGHLTVQLPGVMLRKGKNDKDNSEDSNIIMKTPTQ